MAVPVQRPAKEQEQRHEQAQAPAQRQEQERATIPRIHFELPRFWKRHMREVEQGRVTALEVPTIQYSWDHLTRHDEVVSSEGNVAMIAPEASTVLARASYMFTLELIFRAWIWATEEKSNSLKVDHVAMGLMDVFTKRDTFHFPAALLPQVLEDLIARRRLTFAVDRPTSNAAPVNDKPGTSNDSATEDVPTKSSADDKMDATITAAPNCNWPTSSDSDSSDGNHA